MISKKEIKRIISLITKEVPDVALIYLFGSATSPYYNESSDIDVAVLARQRLNFDDKLSLIVQLQHAMHRAIDLLDFGTLDPVMRMEIVGKGELLYAADQKFKEKTEGETLSRYLLLNEDRKPILDQIKKDGRIYG